MSAGSGKTVLMLVGRSSSVMSVRAEAEQGRSLQSALGARGRGAGGREEGARVAGPAGSTLPLGLAADDAPFWTRSWAALTFGFFLAAASESFFIDQICERGKGGRGRGQRLAVRHLAAGRSACGEGQARAWVGPAAAASRVGVQPRSTEHTHLHVGRGAVLSCVGLGREGSVSSARSRVGVRRPGSSRPAGVA